MICCACLGRGKDKVNVFQGFNAEVIFEIEGLSSYLSSVCGFALMNAKKIRGKTLTFLNKCVFYIFLYLCLYE